MTAFRPTSAVLIVGNSLLMCGLIGTMVVLVCGAPTVYVVFSTLHFVWALETVYMVAFVLLMAWMFFTLKATYYLGKGATEALELSLLIPMMACSILAFVMLLIFVIKTQNLDFQLLFAVECTLASTGCEWKLAWLDSASIALLATTGLLGLVELFSCFLIFRFDFEYPHVEDEYAVGNELGEHGFVPPKDRPSQKWVRSISKEDYDGIVEDYTDSDVGDGEQGGLVSGGTRNSLGGRRTRGRV